MNKKEFLLKILIQLEPIRDLAKGLKILVEQGNLGDETLDILINAVQGAINTTKSELDKNKLQKGLNALQRLKDMEEKSRMQDEKDLSELDNMLDNMLEDF